MKTIQTADTELLLYFSVSLGRFVFVRFGINVLLGLRTVRAAIGSILTTD